MPKISIVLPSYNGERWLRESIDSVINQTIKDWELIIVDDCSDDNTLSIAREFEARDARIKVIHNENNLKLPSSLNVGFRATCGEYLTWTSDDNMFESTALEKMVNFLDANSKYAMVCTAMKHVDVNGNFVADRRGYTDEMMYYNDYVGASFMYRKEVLSEVGEYDETFFCVEDYEYWFRILIHYGSIGYIDEFLYIDRLHPQSLSVSKHDMVLKQLAKMRRKYIDIIVDKLKDRPDLLTSMYYEFVDISEDTEDVKEKIFNAVDVLKKYERTKNDNEKQFIIYGAGNIGSKAHELLGDKVYCFADGNSEKVGSQKEGLDIISVNDMINIKNEFNIVVSIGNRLVYELLNILNINDVDECYVYQSIK